MKRKHYRLTEAAAGDVRQILVESGRTFGPLQRDRYAALLEKALELVLENPLRPGSRNCGHLVEGGRSFHIELAARRLGAASHVIFYVPVPEGGVDVVRVLHEAMDPTRHIGPSSR